VIVVVIVVVVVVSCVDVVQTLHRAVAAAPFFHAATPLLPYSTVVAFVE